MCVQVHAPEQASSLNTDRKRPAAGTQELKPTLAWCDINTGELNDLEGACLADDIDIFDYSPFLPNGEGLLAVIPRPNPSVVYGVRPSTKSAVLVKWDGSKTPLLADRASMLFQRKTLAHSAWRNNTLVLQSDTHKLHVDTVGCRSTAHSRRHPLASLANTAKYDLATPLAKRKTAFARYLGSAPDSKTLIGLHHSPTDNEQPLAIVDELFNARISPDRQHIVILVTRNDRTVLLVTANDETNLKEIALY